jgi:hypothetical protein
VKQRALLVLAFALFMLAPSVARARGCTEVTDIVGEQHCTKYGQSWGIERQFPITSFFGMRYSELSTGNTTFDEQTNKQTRPDGYQKYSYPGEALGVKSLAAAGMEGGFGFFLYGQLYMKVEGSFMFGSAKTASFRASNGVQLASDDGIDVTMVQGGLPIGYRIPLGRASIRAEMMVGVASTTISQRVDAQGLPSTVSSTETRFLLEPQVHADIWFSQHISFGGYVGMNVLDTDGRSRSFGFALTWHNRSFDGDTSF